MKDNYTHITFVLDRSGSMASVMSDTIGGLRTFLKTQKDIQGDLTFTFVHFDNVYEVIHNGINLKEAWELNGYNYEPRGSTALLDAIGRAIEETGKFLSEKPEHERPARVVFVILTDGLENSSEKFTNAQINELITRQRDEYKWEFVYLGANQDAIAEASKMGIATQNAMTYAHTSAGTKDAFMSVGANVRGFAEKTSCSAQFSVAQRKTQEELLKQSTPR